VTVYIHISKTLFLQYLAHYIKHIALFWEERK